MQNSEFKVGDLVVSVKPVKGNLYLWKIDSILENCKYRCLSENLTYTKDFHVGNIRKIERRTSYEKGDMVILKDTIEICIISKVIDENTIECSRRTKDTLLPYKSIFQKEDLV